MVMHPLAQTFDPCLPVGERGTAAAGPYRLERIAEGDWSVDQEEPLLFSPGYLVLVWLLN